MKIEAKIIDNKNSYLGDVLIEEIKWADDVMLAVAYATYNAFNYIKSDVIELLNRGGKLRALFDIERRITDVEIIEEISTIPGDSECKVFYRPMSERPDDEKDRPSFHPKLYIFRKDDKAKIILGSSNFTNAGLHRNVEMNMEVECDDESEFYFQIFSRFYEMWNSWYALPASDNWELIESYGQVKKSQKKSTAKFEQKEKQIIEKIEEIVDRSALDLKKPLNRETAYLFGLLCGKGIIEKTRRKITIRKWSNVMNTSDDANKGYIFVKGISTIKLPQDFAIEKDANNTKETLENLFNRANTGDTIKIVRKGDRHYWVEITFSRDSQYWKKILQLIDKFRGNNYFNNPKVPEELLEANKNLKIAFLRGYFDIRARISQADRFPNEGPLRIALQIGTHAIEFGKTILTMLRDDFDIESARPEWGASRDRDNMIRMNPRDLSINFFSSPWKKLLLKDFQEFNKKNFPSYISPHAVGQRRLL